MRLIMGLARGIRGSDKRPQRPAFRAVPAGAGDRKKSVLIGETGGGCRLERTGLRQVAPCSAGKCREFRGYSGARAVRVDDKPEPQQGFAIEIPTRPNREFSRGEQGNDLADQGSRCALVSYRWSDGASAPLVRLRLPGGAAAAEPALFFDSVTKAALPTRSEVIKSFLSLLSHGRSPKRTTCRKPGPCAPRT